MMTVIFLLAMSALPRRLLSLSTIVGAGFIGVAPSQILYGAPPQSRGA